MTENPNLVSKKKNAVLAYIMLHILYIAFIYAGQTAYFDF